MPHATFARSEKILPALLATVLCAVFVGAAAALPGPESDANDVYWDDQFASPGPNAEVFAMVSDGRGNLYIGGDFTTLNGMTVNHVAKWDGAVWSTLGTGTDNGVMALAVDSVGNLYAGGLFTAAGGVAANMLAKWNGSAWSPVGAGLQGQYVLSLATDRSDNLYVGGAITMAGSVPTMGIAIWDGADWSAPAPTLSVGFALAADGVDNLYSLGLWGGGQPCVGHWNGSSWTFLSSFFPMFFGDLALDGSGNLYAGGSFTSMGGVGANRVAKWDGVSWSPLGSGTNGETPCLALDASGSVYAGGSFTAAGGESANRLARWDGAAWSRMGSGIGGGAVSALAVDRNTVAVGGLFTSAGGRVSNRIAVWQPRVNRSLMPLSENPGVWTLGDDAYGFYKPALTTDAGTTVSRAAGLPVTAVMDRAEEILAGGVRVNGAFTLGPDALEFGGTGATMRVEFSEDDAAAYGVSPDDFRAHKLGYAEIYPAEKEAAAYTLLDPAVPAPIRVENGKQIYAINIPLAQAGGTYGALPPSALPPSAPLSPEATGLSPSEIRWGWVDNSDNESGCNVWTDPGADPPSTLRTTTPADAVEWVQSGLAPNSRHTFQVAATNANGDSVKTAPRAGWTLAAVPTAPVVDGATDQTLNVAVGAGDGNPASTEYAIQCVTLGLWVQPGGALGAAAWWQTPADWGTTTVAGLAADTSHTFAATARNTEGVETSPGAPAMGTTNPDTTPPTTVIAFVTPCPTSSHMLELTVVFSEPVNGFDNSSVTVSGTLAGVASVTGTGPEYTVTVTLVDMDANGEIGIGIENGLVADLAGNPFPGAIGPLCSIRNWPGFSSQPQDARLYTGDSHTLSVSLEEEGIVTAYRWRRDDGAKTITDGPAAPQWTLADVTPANAGDYWCEVTFDGSVHASDPANVQVEPRLSIITAPVGGVALRGGSHIFSVAVAGGYGTPTYQWKRNGAGIPGATGNTLTLSDLTPSHNGLYSVEVSDGNNDTIESPPVTLSVSGGLPASGMAGLALLAASLTLAAATRNKRRK